MKSASLPSKRKSPVTGMKSWANYLFRASFWMPVTWRNLTGSGPEFLMDYPPSNCLLSWELALTLSPPLSIKGGGKWDLMPHITCVNPTLQLCCISWIFALLPWTRNDLLGGMIVFFWNSSHLWDPFSRMMMFSMLTYQENKRQKTPLQQSLFPS